MSHVYADTSCLATLVLSVRAARFSRDIADYDYALSRVADIKRLIYFAGLFELW
jgi:hypothetical protein